PMSAAAMTWEEQNRAHLLAALARVRRALEIHQQSGISVPDAGGPSAEPTHEAIAWPDGLAPPALETMCAAFNLSPFERDVLLLCAGVELDSHWVPLIARVSGDDRLTAPTFGLA